MIVYRKKTISIIKYIIACIIFILAMTITFDDVYGFSIPCSIDKTENCSDNQKEFVDEFPDDTDHNNNQNDQNPTVTPEPGTIILLASGLTVLGMMKKKKI